jgi:hypothetical protein
LPTGNGERGDAMVTLASVFLVVIVRTIWPSACCGGQWSPRVTLVSR